MRKFTKIIAALALAASMTTPAFAGTDFSDNWVCTDSIIGNWQYMENGSAATNAWVHDHGYWYLLNEKGDMGVGFVKSFGRYYWMDPQQGTGHYGRMFLTGDSYAGIPIVTEMGGAYEGALSDETIALIRQESSLSFLLDCADDISGTRHIEAE